MTSFSNNASMTVFRSRKSVKKGMPVPYYIKKWPNEVVSVGFYRLQFGLALSNKK